MLQVDMERERQRALAEAVVRQMDTHELVAIASGRLGAGSLLTSGRGATRVSERANPEESRGVSQVRLPPDLARSHVLKAFTYLALCAPPMV